MHLYSNRKTKRILCVILSLLIAFAGLGRPAEAETLKLKDKLTAATGLLEKVMQHQYDTMMSEIEDTIREEGYDYSYSVESFTDLGNPFKDMDYIKLLATYSSILSRAKRENKTLKYDLRTVPYITYNYTEAVSEEKSIHKVEDYEEIEGREGFYEKTGYHYSDMDEEEGVYEETDEPGVFRLTGTHTVTPDMKTVRYMDITVRVLEPDDLFTIMGIDKDSEYAEDIERREGLLNSAGDNDSLRAGIFLKLPDSILSLDDWTNLFLDRVGYREGVPVRIDGEAIAAIASTLEGQVPYQWGGKAARAGYDSSWWSYDVNTRMQKGLDCSGFVQWVYITAGFDRSVTDRLLSTHIMNSNFSAVDYSDVRIGDIGLNMSRKIGHCGIYAGNGKWWHCSSAAGTVVLSDGAGLGFAKVIRPVDMDREYVYKNIEVIEEPTVANDLLETSGDEEESEVFNEDKEPRELRGDTRVRHTEDPEEEVSEETSEQASEETEEETTEEKRKDEEDKKNEESRKAEEDARKTEEEQKKAEEDARKAEEERKAAEDQQRRTEELKKQQEELKKAEEEQKKAEEERKNAEKLESAFLDISETANSSPAIQLQTLGSTVPTNDADVMTLAKLITHEANNQGINGWIAVGEVVRNRVSSPLFPNTYQSVIYQKGQFTGVSALAKITPRQEIIDVARGVMEGRYGVLGNAGVLYFRNCGNNTSNWGRHARFTKIGDHTFYLQ